MPQDKREKKPQQDKESEEFSGVTGEFKRFVLYGLREASPILIAVVQNRWAWWLLAVVAVSQR